MKSLRFSPAAITPVYAYDIVTSLFSHGGGVKKFEESLADYFSHENVYTFASLMRTVYATFIALKHESNRCKVIIPRYSCPSFIHGVHAAGLEVEYCDINPETLSIDLESLTPFNMEEILAVVCTNLFGLTSEIDAILDLCKPAGAYVIEGVDYGIGTEYKGRRIGSWGDVAILNFQEGKAIPVGGGAIVSSLPKLREMYGYNRTPSLPNYLTMCAFSMFSRPLTYGIIVKLLQLIRVQRKNLSMEDTIRKTQIETDYKFDSKRFDRSISDFQGNLGLRVLGRLEKDMDCRYKNAGLLRQMVSSSLTHVIKPHDAVNKVHYIRFPLLVDQGERDAVLSKLMRSGIEASPMYIEHGMTVDSSLYPGSARVASELLTLPCHPYMNKDDINKIDKIFSEYRN